MELIYDSIYNERHASITSLVEWIEVQPDIAKAIENSDWVAGLPARDIRRIVKFRERFPHWREEKKVPPVLVQKSLLLDGRYGEEAAIRNTALQEQDSDGHS